MTLAEIYEGRFRGDIRFRGAAYLEAERVVLTQITPEYVMGLVEDGAEYQTQLTRDADQLHMSCNCKLGSRPQPACKHIWATILAVDEQRILSGIPRQGQIPPFVTISDFRSEPIDWDEEELDESLIPQFPNRATRSELAEPVLPDWQKKLLSVKQSLDARSAADTTSRDREIFYEIDIERSREAQQFVIHTSQRQRRSSGQWGKIKPLKIRGDRLHEIEDEDDRKLISYMTGAIAERASWYSQQSETQTAISRFRIPFELGETLLPIMCHSQRLRIAEETSRETQPLTWDDNHAWDLVLSVSRADDEEDEEGWTLQGKLSRGKTLVGLQDVRLIVPGGFVIVGHTIAHFRDDGTFSWIELLRNGAPFIPKNAEHELVDNLFDMPVLPRLELPEELQLEEVRAEPKPQLLIRTPRKSRWQADKVHCELVFDYENSKVRGSSRQWAIVQRKEKRYLVRDSEKEDDAWQQLHDSGFRLLQHRRQQGRDAEIPIKSLGPAVRQLVKLGWEVHADGSRVHQPGELKFRVESNIDWFELHGDVEFDGRHISFPELLSALSRGETTIRLDDGSLGILPEEWISEYGLLSGLGETEENHLKFSANQIALLDALLAAQDSVDYDKTFQDLRENFRTSIADLACDEPDGFVGELRGYQREGIGWMSFLQQFQLGGCLADDMGLGKTIQVLAILQERVRNTPSLPPTLIVVPKSLLFNWAQECARFTPELKVLEYSGLDRASLRPTFPEYNIILSTYGTVRRDIMSLREIQFDYLVLDEAQTIKNPGSQIAKACRLLQGEHRIALSGTPIENHLGDLWSIFEFLNPGMLGRSSAFKLFAADSQDEESRTLLANGLRPFILRRTKKQVASELPEKIEQTILCDMGPEQERMYEELRDHYRQSLLGMVAQQGLNKSKMHVLEALLRLRQAACHPALLDEKLIDDSSAKLDVLTMHLDELLMEGHKALVFSQFTSMLAIVKKHLDKRGIVYEYLDGQTRNRKERVERFQSDDECGVFLISLKAGGLGLNLTAADYVFLLDPWWNPAIESQAIDRAHRVGQSRKVVAYRLICRNSVEERIAELQGKKRSLAEAILTADNSMIRNLTSEELEMLLM